MCIGSGRCGSCAPGGGTRRCSPIHSPHPETNINVMTNECTTPSATQGILNPIFMLKVITHVQTSVILCGTPTPHFRSLLKYTDMAIHYIHWNPLVWGLWVYNTFLIAFLLRSINGRCLVKSHLSYIFAIKSLKVIVCFLYKTIDKCGLKYKNYIC